MDRGARHRCPFVLGRPGSLTPRASVDRGGDGDGTATSSTRPTSARPCGSPRASTPPGRRACPGPRAGWGRAGGSRGGSSRRRCPEAARAAGGPEFLEGRTRPWRTPASTPARPGPVPPGQGGVPDASSQGGAGSISSGFFRPLPARFHFNLGGGSRSPTFRDGVFGLQGRPFPGPVSDTRRVVLSAGPSVRRVVFET